MGVDQQWWRQGLPMQIRLPGSLQEQGYGEDPGLDTAWVGNIVDRSLFEDPRYAPYREPGNFKVPFWLQPDKHYNGAAWYRRPGAAAPTSTGLSRWWRRCSLRR